MTAPKRILILTNDTGFGHRSAANAIAEALVESHGDECLVEVVNPLDDERAPAVLRDAQVDYDKMVREMPDSYKLRYELSDAAVPNAIVESAVTVMLFSIFRDLFARFKPDVIVATHSMYAAPASAVMAIQQWNIPYMVVVTDLTNVHRMWFNKSADLILVPTRHAYEQALELGIPSPQVIVTGIPVHPRLAKETRSPQDIRRELGWQPDQKTVLVVGSKRIKGMEEVLNAINHAAMPMQMVVVAGGDGELFERLRKVDWHIPVHLYNFVENLPAMLCSADCVVSKAGGLIVTESLACRRPLLLIDITPGQEEGNAEYVVQNEAGALARTPVEALEHLYHWLHDPTRLAQTQERAHAIGRPLAAYTVADLAWTITPRSQPAPAVGSSPVLPMLRDLLASFGIRVEEG